MIVVVDYGAGNFGSLLNMFRRIGAPARLSGDPAAIESAERLVLPGVGAFDHGMRNLETAGLIPLLRRRVFDERVPTLGVCLGMQLLAARSEEGELPGLGWVEGEVVRFRFERADPQRVPHMGWNSVRAPRAHPLLEGLEDGARFYFAHSYHLAGAGSAQSIGLTTYGYEFPSMLAEGNLAGVQFHPEKSHRFGMRLLANFAEWAPAGDAA